jgi:uncharacterized OsmC-like protein
MINGVDTNALEETVRAITSSPGLAEVTFGLDSAWQSGCRQRALTSPLIQNGTQVASRTATHVLESDEPLALLGTDQAASPGEYILQALAGCYAVTFATQAAVRGIELSKLRLELHADFDLHGFLGLNDATRPGAQQVRVVVHAESSNAGREELEALTEAVQARSPIHDTLAAPVAVRTMLADAVGKGAEQVDA